MTQLTALPNPVPLDEIKAAQNRIKGNVNRTPLIRLYHDEFPGEIYLTLENLQPIGSFKLRGACNAMSMATKAMLADGVYTASAANIAQGVAWCANALKNHCKLIAPC